MNISPFQYWLHCHLPAHQEVWFPGPSIPPSSAFQSTRAPMPLLAPLPGPSPDCTLELWKELAETSNTWVQSQSWDSIYLMCGPGTGVIFLLQLILKCSWCWKPLPWSLPRLLRNSVCHLKTPVYFSITLPVSFLALIETRLFPEDTVSLCSFYFSSLQCFLPLSCSANVIDELISLLKEK